MRIQEFVGVYDADGGLKGEASYVVGKLWGQRHCALCDITHSPVRRKPEWDAMVRSLRVPFALMHRNEMPHDVSQVVAEGPLAMVLARTDSGLVQLLSAEELDAIDGAVASFEIALRERVSTLGLELGSAPASH